MLVKISISMHHISLMTCVKFDGHWYDESEDIDSRVLAFCEEKYHRKASQRARWEEKPWNFKITTPQDTRQWQTQKREGEVGFLWTIRIKRTKVRTSTTQRSGGLFFTSDGRVVLVILVIEVRYHHRIFCFRVRMRLRSGSWDDARRVVSNVVARSV